ncbi:MAG: Nramp family divalent metal transporter [Limisphaerales bacterium]
MALGPGAIVASLTIGSGELIFSSRAGALFGYRTLGLFALVLLLKWALVFSSARYWIDTDDHPLRRWAELPGPRGWLPWTLLLIAAPAFPVWVSFHSGTVGTLLGAITGTGAAWNGNASLIWGILALSGILILSATGGYARQERFQMTVVALMLVSVVVALILLRPDWIDLIAGFFWMGPLEYPDWAATLPDFRDRPVWVESATYAGVVGGSGYDYLAYVAWLRDKHGSAGSRRVQPAALRRLVAMDATVSFVAVLLFSAVFVACGAILLAPQHQVPAGSDLLTLQSQFVTSVGAWLKPLYFAGALLALAGTLYGTIEVAPAVFGELVRAVGSGDSPTMPGRSRRWSVGWCGTGALGILVFTLVGRWVTGSREPFNLVALVTPANLFTGVLACGWISALNVWADRTTPARPGLTRMGWALTALNVLGAVVFCGIGAKGIWDQGGWVGVLVVAGCVSAGWLAASLAGRRGRGISR